MRSGRRHPKFADAMSNPTPRNAAPATRSVATTHGICVTVESTHLPQHSAPAANRYVFAYRVRIENRSSTTMQLTSRKWLITHGDGHREEVAGPGVVGEQPILRPGDHFEYTSGCVLRTPFGSMAGSYFMRTNEGVELEVEIACFRLAAPHTLN